MPSVHPANRTTANEIQIKTESPQPETESENPINCTDFAPLCSNHPSFFDTEKHPNTFPQRIYRIAAFHFSQRYQVFVVDAQGIEPWTSPA